MRGKNLDKVKNSGVDFGLERKIYKTRLDKTYFLYLRPETGKYVELMADESGCSTSMYVDALIHCAMGSPPIYVDKRKYKRFMQHCRRRALGENSEVVESGITTEPGLRNNGAKAVS